MGNYCRVLRREYQRSSLCFNRITQAAVLKIDWGFGCRQGQKLLLQYFWLRPHGDSRGGKKWSDSERVLKVELTGFPPRFLARPSRRMHYQLSRKDCGGKGWGQWEGDQDFSLGHVEIEMRIRHPSVMQSRQSDTQLWIWERGLNCRFKFGSGQFIDGI